MPEHEVGTREEWAAAREQPLERERELGEQIAKQRQALPWVPVEKEYTFDTEGGRKTLVELFDGRSQLLIYHLMFGPTRVPGLHGPGRPLRRSARPRMVAEPEPWLEDWAGSVGTDLAHGLAESPGWNVLKLDDGAVYHTYSRTAPDRFLLAPFYYQLLDQVPDGRDADFPLRRHDEYEE